jgi:hypothetical protein
MNLENDAYGAQYSWSIVALREDGSQVWKPRAENYNHKHERCSVGRNVTYTGQDRGIPWLYRMKKSDISSQMCTPKNSTCLEVLQLACHRCD